MSATESRHVTVPELVSRKGTGRRIVMVTGYDVTAAALLDDSGVDIVFVGDTLGEGVLGHDSTIPVTMDDMVHHVRAVRRGVRRALLLGDLPFLTYQVSLPDSLHNAGRLVQEGGADAVKLEGAGPEVLRFVEACTRMGVPVCGHLGLTPQSVHALGGYRVQGRQQDQADRIVAQARALSDAGAFAVVLECVPADLGERVTGEIPVPTIGIGAGPHTDGQVLVYHDLIGLTGGKLPKFVKPFADARGEIDATARAWMDDVREGVDTSAT